MQVREEQPSDLPAIHAVNEDAFGRRQEAKLVDDLRSAGDLAISLVAEQADQIIAHIALSRLKSPTGALALAPLAVSTARRRLGIGALLVSQSLRRARQRGWESVFVLGDPGYYSRFGFSAKAAARFPCRYAGPYFMALFLSDTPTTSERVIYPAPFDDLN